MIRPSQQLPNPSAPAASIRRTGPSERNTVSASSLMATSSSAVPSSNVSRMPRTQELPLRLPRRGKSVCTYLAPRACIWAATSAVTGSCPSSATVTAASGKRRRTQRNAARDSAASRLKVKMVILIIVVLYFRPGRRDNWNRHERESGWNPVHTG